MIRRRRCSVRSGILFVALPFVLAAVSVCGEALPTEATVAGSYTAVVFTVREGDGPAQDILALGGFIDLVLLPDGTTTGRLFVPGGDEDGGDLDLDLIGIWSLEGRTVTFWHVSDTFIRDMPFRVEGDRLKGQGVFSGVTITVELARARRVGRVSAPGCAISGC